VTSRRAKRRQRATPLSRTGAGLNSRTLSNRTITPGDRWRLGWLRYKRPSLTLECAPLFSPGPQDRVLRHGGDPITRRSKQPTPDERAYRGLHGALGQAGCADDVLMARSQRRRSSGRPVPEMQIDEECRRPAIVQHEVGHQRVHHVRVESELLHGRYSNNNYSDKEDPCAGLRDVVISRA
jgi:hypothetical protein